MNKLTNLIKKIVLSLIGFPILAVGIVLIPLPGPGILISLLGLFILSFAFDSLKPYLEKCKTIIKNVHKRAKDREAEFLEKHK